MGTEGATGRATEGLTGRSPAHRLAIAGLLFNALAWGVSWWPFRELGERGLHPLWATVAIYALGVAALTAWRPRAWGQLLRAPALWGLLMASGITNATFNWGVTIGDVVRVVLLFYLMPLWAVLLARWLLSEPLTAGALLRLALALAGAAVVLWPQGPAVAVDVLASPSAPPAWLPGLPLPRTLAEWLGLAGGMGFALTNVLLRREAAQPESARALAMFLGGALVAGALALALSVAGQVPWPGPAVAWGAGVALLAIWFLASNLALQYGAARVPANVTAVVMVSEVLFAGVSAIALGASQVTLALALGAGLIVAASLLAARS